jgi:menaquinol-cytochrome c reductase iron-sulfur subunit
MPRYIDDERIPGAFDGETVTRRRFMTLSAHGAGAIATAAITIPALGFAIGPLFTRLPVMWQPIGRADDIPDDTFITAVIRLTPDAIGEANRSTVFVRRRDPLIDTEPIDRFTHFIAISSRCVHVGCPVGYKDAAKSFVCPCHGGVYDFRGRRIGGPPPRPLDRFLTRVRRGMVEIGPRFSMNSRLKRFSPRDPGEPLDGIGPILYPPRPSTAKLPKP